MIRPVEWRNGAVVLLDQRLLPMQEVYRVYRDHRDVARAIKEMVVRGAPAIGVAAMGSPSACADRRRGPVARLRTHLPPLRHHAPDGDQPLLGH
jgi:methylthioribose-1-phosphate isomerase